MTNRLLPLVAAATLALLSATASATFLDFKVDEGSVSGTAPNVFTADKLNGGYIEYLAADGFGNFSAAGVANFSAFYANEGTTLLNTQLGDFGANGYNLYAIFSESGTYSGSTFFTAAGQFKLYIDVNSDTTFASPFSDGTTIPVPSGGAADDYLIAFSTAVGQPSFGDLGGPPGAFDLRFTDFTLTAAGSDYFIDPNPFYLYTEINGDYDQFVPGAPSLITGDVSAVFLATPEPASLALVGLALAGLGWTQRRKAR